MLIIDSADASDASFYSRARWPSGRRRHSPWRSRPRRASVRHARQAQRRDHQRRGGAASVFPARCCGATWKAAAACWSHSASSVWPNTETNLLPGKPGRWSSGPAAAVRPLAGAITATRCSEFRAPRSGDPPRRASTATAPSKRRRATACWRATTMARRPRRRNGASAPGVSSPGRPRSTASGGPPADPGVPRWCTCRVSRPVREDHRMDHGRPGGRSVGHAEAENRPHRHDPAMSASTCRKRPGVELNEQGVRDPRRVRRRGSRRPHRRQPRPRRIGPVAVDPQELVAAVTGRAGAAVEVGRRRPRSPPTPKSSRGSGGICCWPGCPAAAETAIANRLSRNERFT